MRNKRRPKQEKPNQIKEQKMKLKTQILAIILGLAASTSLVWSADRPPRETTPTIQGVWQVTRMGADGEDPNQPRPPFPPQMTFYRAAPLPASPTPPRPAPPNT